MLRWLFCGVAIIGTAVQAHAADGAEPYLRGSSVVAAPGGPRWDGFYVGGDVGMSVPGIDFMNNTPQVTALLGGPPITSRTATALGTQDSTSKHFGGFIGYNTPGGGPESSVAGA